MGMSKEARKRLEELRIRKEELELEHLEQTVENERARRRNILLAHKRQQEELDKHDREIIAQQSMCKHHKGGKNIEGILNGSDPMYSVIKHTYPWGEIQVICTRCGKPWSDPASIVWGNPNLKAENPELFKEQMREYVEAINFPTDNEPSGTQLFMITHVPQQLAQSA